MAKQKDIEQGLGDLISKIDKIYGKGSIIKMDEAPDYDYDVIPTGSLMLDLALGINGFPRGRVVEMYGAESSGKTTVSLHAIAEAQKLGLNAAFVDVEHAFDKKYAESLGVQMDKLLFSQPTTAEEALEIVNMLVDSGKLGIIVIDSVAALVPKSELEGEMGDSKMGIMARLMSQAMRKLTGSVSKSNTLVVFLNQTRLKIGIVFGNPTTTPGGEALKFYSSIRCEVSRGQQVKDGDEVTANKTKVKVIKNKCAPPFKVAEFQIEFGKGIDRMLEIIDLAVAADIIQKSGSWYSYDDVKIGQGVNNVKVTLNDNPDLLDEIENKVKEVYISGTVELESIEEIGDE